MTTASLAKPASPFAVFRRRDFALLWGGQLVSTMGNALISLAASMLIYRLTHSAFSVGLLLMATAAPSLVLGLVAGVFVDRFDRRRMMIATNLLRALIVCAIPLLALQNTGWLYGLVLLTSCVTQFDDPAYASLLPEVASSEELAVANTLVTISVFGATAVGFAAAGFIATQFRIEWTFYSGAAMFVFSALGIAAIALPSRKLEGKTNVPTILRNMQSGITFLLNTPSLRTTYLLFPLIFIVFGMWDALLLPFAHQALGANEFEFGMQEAMTSVGFLVGSFTMARLSNRLLDGQWLTVSCLGMGLVSLIYAQMTSVPIAILLVTVSGFVNAPSLVARNLIIQHNTPRDMRGRVSSIFSVMRNSAFLIGMFAAGFADMVGVRLMILGSALVLLIPGAVALFVPGAGQPAADWKRMLGLLRGASSTLQMGNEQSQNPADIDKLMTQVPALASLSRQQHDLLAQSRVMEMEAGTPIICCGEASNDVYFVLSGCAIAGVEENGIFRLLETMRAGDLFGEIAMLMAIPRTANVVAAEATTLLQVPAATFHHLMENPDLSRFVHQKFLERMERTNVGDLPRFASLDQQGMRELRTE